MATLVRWEPFRELASLQNEMSRLMSSVFEGTGGNGGEGRTWLPAVDIWETDDELVYAFDLPGVPQDKITIEFDDGALTVSAEREQSEEVSKERYYRFERRYGTFSRTVALPQGIDESKIRAEYKDGVVEVHVAKPEQAKPKRIEIGGTSEPKTIEGTAKPA
ncbi:MAG TPA: Hsp20/alpha crystallin family protein [Gaiellaceae bacterium]|nr:Hsp20/alpha crystallin family protein [Gaiellaceae bacterium]